MTEKYNKILTREILYIGSECERFSPINIEKEYKKLEKIITDKFLILNRVETPTIENIYANWEKLRPEIVVFSCHGEEFDLFIKDDLGNCTTYSALNIKEFFQTRIIYTRCVILSACSSLTIGKEVNKCGIDVVAINKKVKTTTAEKFTKYFFSYLNMHSLAYNAVYQQAFDYSNELVRAQNLEDSFSFEFLKSNLKQ